MLHHGGGIPQRARFPERCATTSAAQADEIWVIDCSPEGHQPEVNTSIFQAVQQPVCIVLASRSIRRPTGRRRRRSCFHAIPRRASAGGEVRGESGTLKLEDANVGRSARRSRAGKVSTHRPPKVVQLNQGALSHFFSLQWLRRHARANLDHLPGCGVSLERRWRRLVKATLSKRKGWFPPAPSQ